MLIICALALLTCIASSKILYRFGVPALIIFIALGIMFGTDGIGGIDFNNFEAGEYVASIALAFILFYGGVSTNWKTARPIAAAATVLASVGTILTAGLVGVFCYFVIGTSFLESMLIGAVLSSTDAASVFSILRSRKLSLKDGLAPMLEVESGSNDPFSYMLTIIIVSVMMGNDASMAQTLGVQLLFGIGVGAGLGMAGSVVMHRVKFEIEGFYPIFCIAVCVLGYSLSETIGGNGFLCVYISGIILGNSRIPHKKSIVHFFDALSWLMQIMLFFVLGLLSTPSMMGDIVLPGTLVAICIIFIARPLAVFGILVFFKVPLRHMLFVSWVGLRGAASIAFAIIAEVHTRGAGGSIFSIDIFHMVFFVAILSVSLQGSLLPRFARWLDLVDKDETSVLKTFTDYAEDTHTKLIEYEVNKGNRLDGMSIMDANIPEEVLIIMIKRGDEVVMPKGQTIIKAGDVMVLSADSFENVDYLK